MYGSIIKRCASLEIEHIERGERERDRKWGRIGPHDVEEGLTGQLTAFVASPSSLNMQRNPLK
jgi:hypothetical protein